MPLLKLIWIWNNTVNTEKTQQPLPPSKEKENNNKKTPKTPNKHKNYKKKHCSTMNTLKYVYVWSINHRLGYCFNQKRCWTTTSQFMCICRTSAELEDPNSIATRKAFSTRNETSIFNKSHLVRLLLTVGNSKHVLVGPLGRDVPLRPRTTNHIVSLYSFRNRVG